MKLKIDNISNLQSFIETSIYDYFVVDTISTLCFDDWLNEITIIRR